MEWVSELRANGETLRSERYNGTESDSDMHNSRNCKEQRGDCVTSGVLVLSSSATATERQEREIRHLDRAGY